MRQKSMPVRPFPVVCLVLLFLLSGQLQSAPVTTAIDASTYPREFHTAAGTTRVHHPVITEWSDFRRLAGRMPLEIETAAGDIWIGSATFEVDTEIHFEHRTVSLHNAQLVGWSFDRGTPPAEVLALAREALDDGSDKVALDYLLRTLPPDFEIPDAAKISPQLNFTPPRIVISNRPMRLMLIDGAPSLQVIEGANLEYVVNTDWDIFHHKDSDHWYILSNGSWQSNNMLSSGDWFSTIDLPQEIINLQQNSNWPQVIEALPPRPPETPPLPFTISYEPTELIIVDGEAQLEEIPGTVLRFVKNTGSDLFLLADQYYLLVSGRWFRTKNLKRKWYAVKKLPAVFREIPPDHQKSYVLASVPGTREAQLALIEAAIPRTSIFSISAGDGLEVPYAGPPSFVQIQGTMLERAENTPFQVIMHNNFYYLCHDGAWFSSSRAQGPWRVATEVPEAIYTIPATDPFYNVTFVRLKSFDDSSGDVAYDQSVGYHGVYSNGYSLVYGSGWYYPGHVHAGAYGYNSYWRYPYTYGYGARYNPVYGGYGYRGGYGYGRYYGYGGYYGHSSSATYEVNKPDKDWVWDLEGNKRQVYDQGPRNHVGSGQYVLPDGKLYQGEKAVNRGSIDSYVAGNNGQDDLYSGPDGQVYRKTQGGWQQHKDGGWRDLADTDSEYLEQQYRARQAGYKNYDEYLRQRNQ